MRITKRVTVTAAIGVATLALAACGGGGGTTDAGGDAGGADGGSSGGKSMRLALNQTEEHPSYIALDDFGAALSEATDGRWSIDVHANETLGAQAETLQLVSDGAIDMAIVSGTQLENLNDDFVVFNLPTVFESVEHQMSVMADDEITGELFTALESGNSISVIGGFTQGARSMYTKDSPVETPADMAGRKIRVQESELFLSLISTLGGSPTPMAYGEVYTALQSGVIDGAENNEVSYFTQQHFEVAPFFSSTRHLIGIDYLIINTNVLNEMSDEDRAAFDEGWDAAWQQHTELWTEATDEAIAGAEAGGATFVDVDSEAFTEALTPIVDEFLETDSQRELFDAAQGAAG